MRSLAAICVLVLVSLAPATADEGVGRLIQRGDRFYQQRGRGDKWVEKALESYEKALALDPKNVEASWKFARGSLWLGAKAEEKELSLEIFKKGIELAKRAAAIDDRSVECHYWLGACYGRYAEFSGVTKSLGLVEPIKKEFYRVVELDETYESGGGHRSLGFMFFKLPSIAGGSNEKAVEHLRRAIEIDENHLLNHLFLAEVYIGEGEEKLAKKHLELILEAEYEEGRRPENDEQKTRAKMLLGKLTEE